MAAYLNGIQSSILNGISKAARVSVVIWKFAWSEFDSNLSNDEVNNID